MEAEADEDGASGEMLRGFELYADVDEGVSSPTTDVRFKKIH